MSDSPFLRDDATTRRLLHLCAFLLVAAPFLQAGGQLWPWQLRNIQWRFTAASVLATALVLPSAGIVLSLATARAAGQRGLQRLLGAVSLVFVAGLLACTANFALDALQLREIVSSANMPAFKATAARVVVLCVLFLAVFTWAAVAAFGGGSKRQPAASRRIRKKADDLGLLVAQD